MLRWTITRDGQTSPCSSSIASKVPAIGNATAASQVDGGLIELQDIPTTFGLEYTGPPLAR